MMKVTIKEKFNTSRGLVLTIATDGLGSVKNGDVVEAAGKKYTVISVIMGTTPASINTVGLLVK